MSDATVEKVRAMVAPLLADLKLDLYDIEFRGGTLRITIDTPPGSETGVDLEQIAFVTRMVSRDLDHDDPMPGRYTLEVSSPGLERTMRTPEHFRREVGKTVAIRLRDLGGGDRRVNGVLVAATAEDITVRLDDAQLTERVIRIDQIDRAKTVFVWGPAPKPGKGGPTKRKPPSTRGAAVAAALQAGQSAQKGPSDELDPLPKGDDDFDDEDDDPDELDDELEDDDIDDDIDDDDELDDDEIDEPTTTTTDPENQEAR